MIKFPLATEKAIRMMESENKLTFVVERKATKPDVKKAIEELFKVKVIKVNTHIAHRTGRKHAVVKFAAENPAIDIATDLGLL